METASGNFLDLYWTLQDHQGSVTSVLSHNGEQTSVVQALTYTAFGAIGSIKDGAGNAVTTGPISRFAYTGREFDPETGDYYYRARYFDPQTGRFLSQDPIGFAAGDMNLYRYVGNSTPNFTDPSGLAANGFWSGFGAGYWHYLTHPSEMPWYVRYPFYGAAGTSAVCFAAAGGVGVYQGAVLGGRSILIESGVSWGRIGSGGIIQIRPDKCPVWFRLDYHAFFKGGPNRLHIDAPIWN
ncbi:RHS repeat-associated core domain-containing protein [bacterium]|nr:RHS repeat-associated core domain-containing protein [bacterium]